jgi:nitrate/TMAO reductase-like tetraheme cytochrome c subunit
VNLRRSLGSLFGSLTSHPLGFAGVLLASTSSILFLILLALEMAGLIESPYVGILTFVVLPGLFVLALALMPLARYLEARARKRVVVVDLSRPEHQQRALVLFGLTVANVAILSIATYKGVEFTDSNTFCGQVCHQVMEPEYTAYRNSPHSRVPCVSCHIGSGADFFVRYKINGLSQVLAVARNAYPRPIPTPVANLRPARETCETCHWPAQFHGDKLLVKSRFQEDEVNTRLDTVMLLKVGGGGPESGFSTGIHRHASADYTVRYAAADRERQDIVWVEMENSAGEKTVYTKGGVELPDSVLAMLERHTMDCMDCHNRPTHVYKAPDDALDRAFLAGTLDRGLPRLKKLGMELLTKEYSSKDEALAAIPLRVEEFYRTNYAEVHEQFRSSIDQAGRTIRDAYAGNIFPSMNITWNTYPNHVGHREGGGCFRCHAGEHSSVDGREIASDCDACHTLLAMEEKEPAILGELFPGDAGR